MDENFLQKSTLPNYRWIKFGIEYINEPDFMQLSDGAAGTYLKLYLLAGKADAGGLLCNSNRVFTKQDLAWFLRCSQENITSHLEELSSAGMMAVDDGGYKITRFLQEQGPGDNVDRAKWRARQEKARARARGESEPEPELEPEPEAEAEGEGEGEVDSHGDIPVTKTEPLPPPPAAAPSFPTDIDEEIFQNYWKVRAGRKLGKTKLAEFFKVILAEGYQQDWSGRLCDCLDAWSTICKNHKEEGWVVGNPDALMELYPAPNLEERMEREGVWWKMPEKEKKRKETLQKFGLA